MIHWWFHRPWGQDEARLPNPHWGFCSVGRASDLDDAVHSKHTCIHTYLPTYMMTCTQNTAHIWSLVRASRVIGVMTWRVSPLMPLKERPDDELCSLKLDGVMHRIAAPGIGVWMLWPWVYPGGAFPTKQKKILKSDLKKLREFGGEMW